MGKQGKTEVQAEVLEALPGAKFRVKLPNGLKVIAYLSGKLKMHKINIKPGDTVTLELSAYDLSQGRIISHKQATKK